MPDFAAARLSRRLFVAGLAPAILRAQSSRRPNILFAISDDQSFGHTSADGDPVVKTPAFDRVAGSGIRFRQAYCASPGCAPSRAAILTGRYPWQLGPAGTHASYFPKELTVYPRLLERAGYFTGLTGKGAGPANFQGSGWEHNPAGPSFDERKATSSPGISQNDYAANFQSFLSARPKEAPFCFWYGCTEPHRAYDKGSGKRAGKRIADVPVPPFLPDLPEVREDLLDYYQEIEHFDTHLNRMLDALAKRGELENTLVIATSDNGMPFPGAKARMREYGLRLPLAMSWPARSAKARVTDDIVSFVDFAPTILRAAGVNLPPNLEGQSLLPAFDGKPAGRAWAMSGRERHSHARYDNLGYPARSLRRGRWLYVRNFKPDRWPAGDPPFYYDIDASPTRDLLVQRRDDPAVAPFAAAALGKTPELELFDVAADPGCTQNLAGRPEHAARMRTFGRDLAELLSRQGDSRLSEHGDIWESYPRFSPMRPALGGFATEGESNPRYSTR